MRVVKICAVLASILLLSVPLAANPTVESFEWPKSGMLVGERVNLRSGPATSSKVIGRFVDEYEGGELLVTGRSEGREEFPWYRVVSHKFGEGWLYGKFIAVEEPEDPVRRYALKIREDFGLSPAQAVKMYGEPMKRSREKLHIPDFNVTAEIVTLEFHGHTAIYWDGVLQSVEIPAGFMGFADILLGMDAEEAASRLGTPILRQEDTLIFGFERDEIALTEGKTGGRTVVAGLAYRRVVYD
ncbi:MAG TPA: SH3 domain-containing protein [Synergistales bacterium]|nr:SH3 domain-containing protein [Synergistaceae bacterium]HPE66496.1 SH3 domain-containing protein [Synergistales bacterium]